MNARGVGFSVLSLVLLTQPAAADDYVVPGTKLVLKRSASGAEKTILRIVSPLLPDLDIGGLQPNGLEMTVVSDTEGEFTLVAQPNNGAFSFWKYGNNSVIRFAGFPSDPVSRVLVKDGMIKLKARVVGLPLATVHGALAVRLVVGTLRACVRFEGPDVVRKDEPGKVLASNAPPGTLADCSDEALGIGSPSGAFLD